MVCSCVSLWLMVVERVTFPAVRSQVTLLCVTVQRRVGLKGSRGKPAMAGCCILSKDGKKGFLFSFLFLSPSLSVQ